MDLWVHLTVGFWGRNEIINGKWVFLVVRKDNMWIFSEHFIIWPSQTAKEALNRTSRLPNTCGLWGHAGRPSSGTAAPRLLRRVHKALPARSSARVCLHRHTPYVLELALIPRHMSGHRFSTGTRRRGLLPPNHTNRHHLKQQVLLPFRVFLQFRLQQQLRNTEVSPSYPRNNAFR